MVKTSWEVIINKCPHCGDDLHIHYRSTISERHLMEMVWSKVNYHLGNQCNIDITPKVINLEIEVESISSTSAAIKMYKPERRKLIF